MSVATTEERMTADEFMAKYGDDSGIELVDGLVVRYPMPGRLHGYISSNVGFIVTRFVKDRDVGRVFTHDTFIQTKPNARRGADVAFLSFERFPRGPVSDGVLPAPPELVVEVRSPTDRWVDIHKKIIEYLDIGVMAVVVVDPETESAGVYRADEIPQRFSNGDELTLPDVLPGFAVPVRQFFE